MISALIQVKHVILSALIVLFAVGVAPEVLFAQSSFSVTPHIIDEIGKPRDIIKKTAVITNNTNHNVKVYAFVHNLDSEQGEQDFLSRTDVDLKDSLANWIEITRAMMRLAPGETRQVPYLIHVNLFAEPGTYHARIGFGSGSNQDDAEKTLTSDTSIAINIEVPDDSKERLQLGLFKSDKTFFSGGAASFTYLLENIGNRALSPQGEVRIYNRRGEEVAAIDASSNGASLLPDATSQLGAVWNTTGNFGRYKAFLDLSYGDKQYGTVQDTVYFWVIPWKKIVGIFLFLSIMVGIVAFMLHKRYQPQDAPVYAPVSSGDSGGGHAPMTLSHSQTQQPPHGRTSVQPQSVVMQPAKQASSGALNLGGKRQLGQSHTISLKK